ncbi:hypothetical protein [Salegentibacter sp. Hel_I_6]|uniref:hypothetical protein n=1 Tax=Salegentibacter sp. Hel_I_6 TaxID=1250278 RepID=UPI000566FB4A|nr:hypothetical protein [Salegentibacter sp. Hel_I_6]
MSEIKRTFLQGKMNMDLDERIIPDGQFVDALNIQVSKSEGSDVGAIENTLGNEQKTNHSFTNAKCIGTFSDNSNQLIYYFVTADEVDFVAEYDDKSQSSTMLLEASRVDGKTLLNFKTDKLITGVVKMISGQPGEDLLGWTDDNEQPRIINIERAKRYGLDGFEEDDISVIKKPPLQAPGINLTYASQGDDSNLNDKFLCFAYAYRYLDGEMSALSPFTTAAFSPNKFQLDQQTFENKGMQNIFSAVDLRFNTGSKRVTDIMLVFKETNSNVCYVVETFNKKDQLWGDFETQSYKFSNSKIYRVLDENELFRLYDNVPRKAKAMDIIGNRLAYGNYLEGYNMLDKFGQRLKIDYNLSLYTRNLEGKLLGYELLTLNAENDLITIDLSGITLAQNTRLRFRFELIEENGGNGTYEGDFDFILNNDFDDATDLGVNPDFIQFIEEVLTQSFLATYTNTPPANSELTGSSPFLIDSFTPTSVTLLAPTLIYDVDNTPGNSEDDDFSTQNIRWSFIEESQIYYKQSATDSSCKTNRSYEAVMIYLDQYGRASTAMSSPYNTLYIPQENSIYQNKIRVNVNHTPPDWAKYFRFALKQNKREYQIIYATIFYEDGLFRWVKLDGANKDKVSEGATLLVKSDLGGPVEEVVKVRVLEIKSQETNFLSDNLDENEQEIKEEAGIYMKIKPSGFDMNYVGDTFVNIPEQYDRSDSRARINLGPFGKTNADGIYEDYPVVSGSQIDIWVRSYGRDPEQLFEKSYTATESYDNFQLWFEAEVGSFDNKVNSYEFFRNSNGELYLNLVSFQHGTFINRTKIRGYINFRFTEGITVFETEPEDALSDIYYEGNQTFEILNQSSHTGNIQEQTTEQPAIIELDFFNCYALGNGVESYRYKDALNSKYLDINTRPTAKSESEYREIRRYADITYSEPYVESLGVNGLNNFNLAKANYKDDVVKKYGAIQHLIARDTDLLLFQEDKISRVLYGKELVVSPDGNSNLANIEQVLGTQVMYAGEHGVSRNPESIAMEGTRVYFTDAKRNQVCRLATDGITVISSYGLTSHFRNMFSESMNKAKIGAYDPYNGKYTLGSNTQTIYNPFVGITCEQSIRKQNFSGTFRAEIDFGISTGEVGVNIVTDSEITVNLIWGNQVFEVTTDGIDSLFFDKTTLLPRTAELVVEAVEPANFEIGGNCAILDEITVISVIRSNVQDAGDILTNRYKWLLDDYPGPYKYYREPFPEDGGLAVYNIEQGDEGVGYIPKTGSKILLESFKGYGDTGSFGADDVLGYLVSDTLYTENDIDELVAAAEMSSPEPENTGGGEVINKVTFDFLRPNSEQYLYLIWDYSSLSININTHIYIYFDSSGSMNTTLAPLQEMRDTILKDALLPLYENDEAAYNEKVTVISNSSERTFQYLNFTNNQPPEGNVISLVFQDEAHNQGNYHGLGGQWTINDPRTNNYNTDLSQFRSRLNSFPSNYYRGVLFQVATPDAGGQHTNFKPLMQAVENGDGQYSGVNGLSDRNEVAFNYDVTPGAGTAYYKDLIVTTLRNMGFNL